MSVSLVLPAPRAEARRVTTVSENSREPTDGELIEHIAGGDSGAFEEL